MIFFALPWIITTVEEVDGLTTPSSEIELNKLF